MSFANASSISHIAASGRAISQDNYGFHMAVFPKFSAGELMSDILTLDLGRER